MFLLIVLDIGVMCLKIGGSWVFFVLMEGFVEVENNNIIIFCNGVEEGVLIDFVVV